MLKNKITFITGASSGIGRACAQQFAGAGSNLILSARRKSKLNDLAKELINVYAVKVYTIELDVRKQDDVKNAIASLPPEWQQIDVLINNAGLAKGFSKIYEADTSNWEEMIDTNFKGLLYVTREILPGMVNRRSGHIINIGSTAGHEVYPYGNVYCATKFAVNALTHGIRLDLLDKNIRVSTVDPGLVETEFSEVRFSGDKERAKKVYEGIIPLNGNDVAEAVLFCANRPPHANIHEIIITPSVQAGNTQVFRR